MHTELWGRVGENVTRSRKGNKLTEKKMAIGTFCIFWQNGHDTITLKTLSTYTHTLYFIRSVEPQCIRWIRREKDGKRSEVHELWTEVKTESEE